MLLTESYLSTTGGLPLGAGTLNQVLCSDSATNFKWMNAVDITGEVLAGVVNYLAFYPASGTKVDDTSFLSIDNSLKILNLEAGAQLKIYPPSGSFYVEFKAPTLAASSAWVLPAIDGLNGYALTTDGVGNLSFIEVGRGVVNTGTPMTLAYYQTADDEVFPWTNIASRVALTTSLNEIAWGLITTEYLSTAGGVPLDVGTPNYMLSPDGFGNFVWVDVVSIVGKVNTAQAKQLAFYAYDGNQVYGSSWLRNYELAKTLEIGDGGSVQFFVVGDTASATLTSSPLMTTTVTWYLPIADATSIGQALVSDAAGQLSFTDLVDFGVQDAVATYQNGTARRVSPSANFFNPASGLLLTGSTFTITGDSVVPTIVTIKGGDSLLGAGANLYLAGGVGAVTSGSTVIGSGSNNYLSIDDGGWVSVLDQASLRFYDSGSNYVGFKAPTTVPSSLIWTLPSADGLAGQFLWTDGAGTLSWVTNRINDGVLNAIPYYSAINELSPSTLLIPTGLPASLGHTLIVDHLTGQLSYKVIVEPLGTAGEIAVYTDTQKVGYYPNLLWDIVSNAIQVRYAGGLTLFEITDTYSTTLRSSPDLVVSTELVLPPDLPAENGYILTGETNGNLLFRAPNSDTRWEKRGIISLQSGMRSVTVLYDTPFDIIPAWINTQWVIGEDNSSYLPTYAVERSTTEGFIIRFSTQIPATGMYRINWQSYLTAVSSQTASIFISGGVDGSGYIDSLMGMLVDNDTMIVLAATLSSPRGFTCGGGSSVNGYIFGGSSPIPLPLGIITSFAYATSVLTDISATLITARSGAAGVGTRSKCYVAGGEVPGGGSFSSIETFDTTTEAVSSLGSSLASNSVSAGSATTKGVGAIAHSGLNSLERLTYATEVLSPSLATFGATDISVGANNATSNRGYFGRNAGYVYKYEFLVDTITVLSAGLNSVTGLSSASNSLDTAYFAGSSLMDALDFSTETVQTVATLPTLGHLAAASSTFQSKGLL
jgi:hypothetical protein